MKIHHLLVAFLASILSSCVSPVAKDSYYEQTAGGVVNPADVSEGDIVGGWYDAWAWNGHKYEEKYAFYPDHTGAMISSNEWRDGGGMRAEGDMQWAYDGHGGWNVRVYNKRIVSGAGSIGDKPYEFHVRKMNGRIYNDTRKRTWVDSKNTAQVLQKSGNTNHGVQARKQFSENLQQMSNSLSSMSSSLNSLAR